MTQTASAAASDSPPILREIITVAGQEILSLLFGLRSIVVVVLYGGLVAAVGTMFLLATAQLEQKLIAQQPALAALDRSALLREGLKSDLFDKEVAPVLEQFGGRRLVEAVSDGRMPFLLLVILALSSFALPGLALITGYDRLSDDLHTRYARFVLQRVRRESWVLGRIAGQSAGLWGLVVITHVLLVLLATAAADGFEAGPVWRALPAIWLGMALFLLAYVAFVALFSALLTPPFAVLAVGGMALMGLWMLKVAVPVVGQVWMGAWDIRLWLLDPLALVVFAVHALVLMAGAVAVLRARDV